MGIITFVANSNGASTGGGTAASLSTAYTSNNTAGNFLVSVYRLPGGSTHTFAVTDTAGNTWTKLLDFNNLTEKYQLWYVLSCVGGANTVKITPDSATFLRILVAEYSGGITAVDTQTSNIGTGNPVSSGTLTTYATGAYAFTGNDNGTVTWGAGIAGFKVASSTTDLLIGFTANQTQDGGIGTFTANAPWITRQNVDTNLYLADQQTHTLVGYGANDCGGQALPAQEPTSTTFAAQTNSVNQLTPNTGRGPTNTGVFYQGGGGGTTPGTGQIFPSGRS